MLDLFGTGAQTAAGRRDRFVTRVSRTVADSRQPPALNPAFSAVSPRYPLSSQKGPQKRTNGFPFVRVRAASHADPDQHFRRHRDVGRGDSRSRSVLQPRHVYGMKLRLGDLAGATGSSICKLPENPNVTANWRRGADSTNGQ